MVALVNRARFWRVVVCAAVVGCQPTQSKKCEPGFVSIASKCERLCSTILECANGEVCSSGICVNAQGAACTDGANCDPTEMCQNGFCTPLSILPRIDTIQGDRSDGTLFAQLHVQGARLMPAQISIAQGSTVIPLETCAGSDASQVYLDMPPTLAPGTYDLVIANDAGTCAQSVQLIQGSPDSAAQIITKLNDARTADPANIAAGTLAGRVTTISASAEGGGLSRSIRISGAEQISSSSQNQAAGMFITILNRHTHQIQTMVNGYPVGANYTTTTSDMNGLRDLIQTLTDEYLVILASRGDITAMATHPTLPTALSTKLGADNIRFATLKATEYYVLISVPDILNGKELEMFAGAPTKPATLSTVLIDSSIIGISQLFPIPP